MLNDWEKVFIDYLDLTEFELTKDGDDFRLVDKQGGNFFNDEDDIFSTATEIFDRMDIIISDYYINSFEEIFDSCEELQDEEMPFSCEEWLNYISNHSNIFCDYEDDIKVLEMIVYHSDEINLNNVYEWLTADW